MPKQTDVKRRYWHFKCGHIGGEVVMRHVGKRADPARGTQHDRRVRTLMLYEQSLTVEPTCVPLDALPLRGKVEGTVRDLRCTVCGATGHWIVGADALQELVDRRLHRLHAVSLTE